MLTDELIARGGSKLEATRLFLERGLEIPMPKSAYLYDGQSLDTIWKWFQAAQKPVIDRTSVVGDWHGMIGVTPTARKIHKWSELEQAVRGNEEQMKNPLLKAFAQDESSPFDEKTHHLVQEQGSDIAGIIMRHPNRPDQINIFCYMNLKLRGGYKKNFLTVATYRPPNKQIFQWTNSYVPNRSLLKAVRMYEKIERSGLLPPGWAYQVEFGLLPLRFYQVRPFKPIEKADFDVNDLNFGKQYLRIEGTYGITPREGIILPFAAVFDIKKEFLDQVWREIDKTKPYILISMGKIGEDLPIIINPSWGALSGFFMQGSRLDYQHGSYRLMKRAMVSGSFEAQEKNRWDPLARMGEIPEIGPRQWTNTGLIRMISDGYSGVLIPVD